MKTTINFSNFCNSFTEANRTDQFSYDALKIIWDDIEEYEQSTGEEMELDVIAICCDYAESHWKDIAYDYSIELDQAKDNEEQQEQVLDYLADQGVFVGITGDSVVYRQF